MVRLDREDRGRTSAKNRENCGDIRNFRRRTVRPSPAQPLLPVSHIPLRYTRTDRGPCRAESRRPWPPSCSCRASRQCKRPCATASTRPASGYRTAPGIFSVAGRLSLRVVRRNGRAVDENIGPPRQMEGVVPLMNPDAAAAKVLHESGRRMQIGTRDRPSEIEKHRGQRVHAGPAEANQVRGTRLSDPSAIAARPVSQGGTESEAPRHKQSW